jgi:hypothetical protein
MKKLNAKEVVDILITEHRAFIQLDGNFLNIRFPYSDKAKEVFGEIVNTSKELKTKWCKSCDCVEVTGKQIYCKVCSRKRRNKSQSKWRKNKQK